MCCAGCQAVAELIIAGGQADYYRFREGTPRKADETILGNLGDWDAFEDVGSVQDDGTSSALVLAGGIHCSACGWLIENQLRKLEGIARVQVDTLTRRVKVNWDPQRISLATVLKSIASLGYRPRPLTAGAEENLNREEKRAAIRRLGVAGLGMMQVMMYAVGTYFGPMGDMDPLMERYLQLVSMLIATPVLVYSGSPFFVGAWRAIKTRHPNMDLPVAVALILAFGLSCLNLYRASGTVYFESVSMFVFFLLLGRFVEMNVRHRSCGATEGLAQVLPETARLETSDGVQSVPRSSLAPGQIVQVRPGDPFAADGILLESGDIDESLLTGESTPCHREAGERVLGGSVNLGSRVRFRVNATGNELLVSQLERLLQRARSQRPVWIRLADTVASGVVGGVLVLAAGVYWFWSSVDPSRAFEAALAVLVVTCPCALSLAVPSALAAAAGKLGRHGLLVSNPGALMQMASVDVALFDKTGTLTHGHPDIVTTRIAEDHPAPVTVENLLALVAAVEEEVSHPIARAFVSHHRGLEVSNVTSVPGQGLRATLEGRELRIGNARLALNDELDSPDANQGNILVYVADQAGFLGEIALKDGPRAEAREMVATLESMGVGCRLVSGDRPAAVTCLAESLNIAVHHGALRPEDKLSTVRDLQKQGHRVLAVGDGVNDAPVLGGADVSIAMVEGAGLAQAGADMVLTGGNLSRVSDAVAVARQMMRIIRQNLSWALAYNLLAIPLAAMGLVAPWMAAIGMSLSSLVVVLNAGRAGRIKHPQGTGSQLQSREVWA